MTEKRGRKRGPGKPRHVHPVKFERPVEKILLSGIEREKVTGAATALLSGRPAPHEVMRKNQEAEQALWQAAESHFGIVPSDYEGNVRPVVEKIFRILFPAGFVSPTPLPPGHGLLLPPTGPVPADFCVVPEPAPAPARPKRPQAPFKWSASHPEAARWYRACLDLRKQGDNRPEARREAAKGIISGTIPAATTLDARLSEMKRDPRIQRIEAVAKLDFDLALSLVDILIIEADASVA